MRQLRVLLIASLASLGCTSAPTFEAQEREPLVVQKTSFQSRLSLSGTLVAATSESIGSPSDEYGLLIRWMADDGTHVKKGDKVLEMDTSSIVSKIETLKTAVTDANNALVQQRNRNTLTVVEKEHLVRQAEFSLAKARIDANVPPDAYPRRVYEDMQVALQRALSVQAGAIETLAIERRIGKNALGETRIALERSKRDLATVQKKIESYVLRAPRDGLLLASKNWREGRAYRSGDKSWPGQSIVEIPDLSVMTVKARLSDVDDGQVHVGMHANCRLDAYPNEVLKGHVISLSPVARKATRGSLRQVFDVVIELESTNQDRMRPGMSVRVDVLGATKENVLVASRQSLVFEEDAVSAELASGKMIEVTLGPCNAQSCVIQSGLQEGMKLRARGLR